MAKAQGADRAVLFGTVTDATGALIPGANARLSPPGAPSASSDQQAETSSTGQFWFAALPGEYVLTVEAPGFAAYTSKPLSLVAAARLHLPVRLAVASLHQQIDILEDEADGGSDPNDLAGAMVLEGDHLKLLSDDPATLQQQLNAMAGGFGSPRFLIDGFSGGRLPTKSSIRSIRINRNPYSAYFDTIGFGRIEIDTKPGTERLHGFVQLSGTNQPWDSRNPYTPIEAPFYDFQQDGNLNGPLGKGALGKKTSFFAAESVERLANNSAVNATDPQNTATTLSDLVPSPQNTTTYSLRVDRQFSPTNFGYIRDEWTQTHVDNSGILPLVLPSAAFSLNTLVNTVQLTDTQLISARTLNEVRLQYIRTRVRQDPNSNAPSLIVQGAFQGGGSPAQALRDNQDAYELQDRFEADRGPHAVRLGFRFRALRDANQSSAGFNGQYIFPDLASFNAGQPTQYSQATGQAGAVLRTDDLGAYAEDDWKLTPNLTFSYGLRFESQSAIPDHSDPGPRLGLAWAVRPGQRKSPIVTLRAGYGIFYDRFPAAQLLQAIRQNGTREIASVVKNPPYNPAGAPAGFGAADNAEPTIFRVDPDLRSSYAQVASVTAIRALGRFGLVSANWLYIHNTHNFLTRNINAPLPGTFDPSDPASGVRPLGTLANVYQFSSAANGNGERFFVNYRLQPTAHIFGFGRFDMSRIYNEADAITSFPSDPYNLRQDYGRSTLNAPWSLTEGIEWTLPFGFTLSPLLYARAGVPFDITIGTDLNGDTIYNDRPAFAASTAQASAVNTILGSFNVAPGATQARIPRNLGTSPAYVWAQLRLERSFRLGPRPAASAAGADGKAPRPPDRPWQFNLGVEVQNLTNHNNPGPPVGVLSAQPCGVAGITPCACPGQGTCALAPSPYFGHSLSLATDFSPITASNRTVVLRSSFTF